MHINYQYVLHKASELLSEGSARILDYGCGNGDVVKELEDDKIPYRNGFFDLVICNQVLEHVDDLDGVLDEIHRVLKPGGALLALFLRRMLSEKATTAFQCPTGFPKAQNCGFIIP